MAAWSWSRIAAPSIAVGGQGGSCGYPFVTETAAMAARISRSVCPAGGPTSVERGTASVWADGTGGDHAGYATGRAVEGGAAFADRGAATASRCAAEQPVGVGDAPRRAGADRAGRAPERYRSRAGTARQAPTSAGGISPMARSTSPPVRRPVRGWIAGGATT